MPMEKKRLGMNPDVETSFLPDREREQELIKFVFFYSKRFIVDDLERRKSLLQNGVYYKRKRRMKILTFLLLIGTVQDIEKTQK